MKIYEVVYKRSTIAITSGHNAAWGERAREDVIIYHDKNSYYVVKLTNYYTTEKPLEYDLKNWFGDDIPPENEILKEILNDALPSDEIISIRPKDLSETVSMP